MQKDGTKLEGAHRRAAFVLSSPTFVPSFALFLMMSFETPSVKDEEVSMALPGESRPSSTFEYFRQNIRNTECSR